MKRLIASFLFIVGSGCLSTVDERWCGPVQPCSAGFICTNSGHCVLPDGGAGGGTGGGSDGGTGGGGGGGIVGGGAGGGAGGGSGGGGGATCGAVSCASGCCLGNNCVPVMAQGNSVCGFFGDVCARCALDEGCVAGRCVPAGPVDAGMTSSVGGPCFDDFDCGDDGIAFCIPGFSGGQPTGFVDGYCSRTCDQQPCPLNSTCVEAETSGGGTINICLSECFGNSCRMGYVCEMQGIGGVCLPL
jgi:hypothetical protein